MGKRELPEDLNTLKVTELKEELVERGLPTSGVKAILVGRLQDYLKKQASEKTEKDSGKETEEVNGKDHQEKDDVEKKEKEQAEKEEKEKKEKEAREKEAREKEAREKEAREKEAREKEARDKEEKEAQELKEKELKEKEQKEKELKEKELKQKEAKEKELKQKELKEKELKEKEKKEKELKEKEQKEKEQKEKEKQKKEEQKKEEQKKTEKVEAEDDKKRKPTEESEPLSTSGRIIKPPSSSTPSTKRQRTWASQPEAITISTTDILKDMLPSPSSSLSSSQVDAEMEEATKNNENNNNGEDSSSRRISQQMYSTPAKREKKQDPAAREVPPAKKPASTTLFIDKFVRPFTHNQVKQLLQQTGVIEYFWMNQVKSQAYVTFKTIEEATATRDAIYDLEWPSGNNSRLRAEFASADEAKKAADHHDSSRSSSTSTPSASASATTAQPTRAENSNSSNLRDSKGARKEEDRGVARGEKGKNVKSAKSLDEMFRKTETKPAIYWLPLSQEQIATKQKAH